RASSRASAAISAPACRLALSVSGPNTAIILSSRLRVGPGSRASRRTPLIEEPGTNGMPVPLSRAIGKSMSSAACPTTAWSGERNQAGAQLDIPVDHRQPPAIPAVLRDEAVRDPAAFKDERSDGNQANALGVGCFECRREIIGQIEQRRRSDLDLDQPAVTAE